MASEQQRLHAVFGKQQLDLMLSGNYRDDDCRQVLELGKLADIVGMEQPLQNRPTTEAIGKDSK
jgi:hypothetical protein